MKVTLIITDQVIRSADTAHSARREPDSWHVSWLPGRTLARNGAITAHDDRRNARPRPRDLPS